MQNDNSEIVKNNIKSIQNDRQLSSFILNYIYLFVTRCFFMGKCKKYSKKDVKDEFINRRGSFINPLVDNEMIKFVKEKRFIAFNGYCIDDIYLSHNFISGRTVNRCLNPKNVIELLKVLQNSIIDNKEDIDHNDVLKQIFNNEYYSNMLAPLFASGKHIVYKEKYRTIYENFIFKLLDNYIEKTGIYKFTIDADLGMKGLENTLLKDTIFAKIMFDNAKFYISQNGNDEGDVTFNDLFNNGYFIVCDFPDSDLYSIFKRDIHNNELISVDAIKDAIMELMKLIDLNKYASEIKELFGIITRISFIINNIGECNRNTFTVDEYIILESLNFVMKQNMDCYKVVNHYEYENSKFNVYENNKDMSNYIGSATPDEAGVCKKCKFINGENCEYEDCIPFSDDVLGGMIAGSFVGILLVITLIVAIGLLIKYIHTSKIVNIQMPPPINNPVNINIPQQANNNPVNNNPFNQHR